MFSRDPARTVSRSVLLLLALALPAAAQEPAPGAIRGVVYDSIDSAPLSGATVTVVGTTNMTVTDAEGSFRLGPVPPGMHRVTFFHPRLDELGLGAAAWEVEVEAGAEAEVALWIPSAASVAAALCRSEPGVLVGVLRAEEEGAAVGGSVLARWEEDGAERSSATMTDERGRYVLCRLPVGREVRIRGASEAGAGVEHRLRLPGSGLLVRDVALDLERAALVSGRVVGASDGAPIEGAEVRVAGSGQAVATDAAGEFRIAGVRPGSRLIEVEHLAFGVHRDTLNVTPGAALDVTVEVAAGAIELEGLDVTARRPYRGRMAGFEERMEQGRGEFLTREQIAERESQPLPRIIVSRTSSIRLVCPDHPGRNPTGTVGRCWIMSRRAMPSLMSSGGGGAQGGGCPMEYFVDGVYLGRDFDITQIDPRGVEALEIYPGPATIPSRFRSTNSTCGVVVVWSREPGADPPS